MATNTPISAITYPNQPDAPNIPSAMSNMVGDMDTILVPRFASTGARDSAISSPVDGQHAYVTADNRLYVYRNSYSAWQRYTVSISKMKTNDQTSTSTTYQDDNHIIGLPYKANTLYTMNGAIFYTSPAAADFKMKLVFSSATQSGFWGIQFSVGGAGDGVVTNIETQIIGIPTAGSNADFSYVSAQFRTHASTAGTIKLQWAQNTASGTTIVHPGCWLEIIEVV